MSMEVRLADLVVDWRREFYDHVGSRRSSVLSVQTGIECMSDR